MLFNDSEAIQHRQASRHVPGFHIEFRADTADEFRFAAYSRKHSGEKEQVARLHRFRVDAEWRRRRWKLDTKFSSPLLSGGGARAIDA